RPRGSRRGLPTPTEIRRLARRESIFRERQNRRRTTLARLPHALSPARLAFLHQPADSRALARAGLESGLRYLKRMSQRTRGSSRSAKVGANSRKLFGLSCGYRRACLTSTQSALSRRL